MVNACCKFKDSIRGKLIIGGSAIIILILIGNLAEFIVNKNIAKDTALIRDVEAPLQVMVEQVIGYDAILTGSAHAVLLHAMGDKNTEEMAEHRVIYDNAGMELDTLLKTRARDLLSKSERSDDLQRKVDEILKKLDEVNLILVEKETTAFNAIDQGKISLAYSELVSEDYHSHKEELLNLYREWASIEADIVRDYRDGILGYSDIAKKINIARFVLVVSAVVLLLLWLLKSTVAPIRKITEVAEEIGSGNIDKKIPEELKNNKSEIGVLARAYDKLITSSRLALEKLVESRMKK